MRIALITGGQPRFTPDFLTLMTNLTGFGRADLYLNFWTSSWANNDNDARKKIEPILKSKYHLSKIKIVNQPQYELPYTKTYHPPAQHENLRWWYERRFGMWCSLKMAFDLIDQDYDLYIRFRTDGTIEKSLDVSKLDLTNQDLVYPSFPRHGYPGKEICDQFVIGNKSGMKFYCSLIDNFNHYIPLVCPDWEKNLHGWSGEHLLGFHLESNNKKQYIDNFRHVLAAHGRSKFTDKHYHLPIVQDPTDIKK